MAPEYPGHNGCGKPGRLGSAVPARSLEGPRPGRKVLGRPRPDAESLHPLREGTRVVADALRRRDVGAICRRSRGAPPRSTRFAASLLASVRPEALGVSVQPVRRLAAEASVGATDFGLYFTYFSFFIVVSALLLAILFFRLGVEARLKQIGILRASGFTIATVRRLLLMEAVALAVAGRRPRHRRRDRVRQPDHVRPANVVGRRGRYHAAGAARDAALARPRGARRGRRRRPLRAGVAADGRRSCRRDPFSTAQTIGQEPAVRMRAWRAAIGSHRARFRRACDRRNRGGLRRRGSPGRSLLRRRRGGADRRDVPAVVVAAVATVQGHRRARRPGHLQTGFPKRRLPSRPQRAVGRPDCVGGVHHRLRRRVPERAAGNSAAIAPPDRRIRARRNIRAAARP